MELPRMPSDSEFDSAFQYEQALKAWERVCLAIIAKDVPVVTPPAQKEG